ncbi:MAG: stage II sporulation protein R [Hespellia sp.]|nr:stage II sporulation protein R [Hespellia sp.]
MRIKYQFKYQKETIIIFALSLIISGLLTGWIFQKSGMEAQAKAQEHLAGEVLRFHILANSDSEEDQNLKMKVKEEVLSYLKTMPEGYDVKQTKNWIRLHLDEIENASRNVIRREGYGYPVSGAVTLCYFPEKTYGDVTFPAGNYEALRIEIGAGEGHNWWCVLYPNLCFVDAVNAVVPEEGKEELRQVLTEEEYKEVTADSDMKIKWYFKEVLDKQ